MSVPLVESLAGEAGARDGPACTSSNRTDPVELALAADMHKSALAHVTESSCDK